MWRMVAGWIWLDLPSAALVVDGEPGFRSWMSCGAAPADGRLADGSIPSLGTGVYFNSFQTQQAMELFQLMVAHGVFAGGDDSER
jgi:hypothetical protein